MYRKGTTLLRKKVKIEGMKNAKQFIVPLHIDMIRDKFWTDHCEILDKTSPQAYEFEKNEDNESTTISRLIQLQIDKQI